MSNQFLLKISLGVFVAQAKELKNQRMSNFTFGNSPRPLSERDRSAIHNMTKTLEMSARDVELPPIRSTLSNEFGFLEK